MTAAPETPENGNQLLDEACLWFARMRGPEAEAYRPQFEAWLARGALHLGAYNRAAGIFAMGKFLAEEAEPAPPVAARTGARRRHVLPAALVASLAVMIGGYTLLHDESPGNAPRVAAREAATAIAGSLHLATARGEIRVFPLPDGSSATLDSDTVLDVRFGAAKRSLILARGRGRFDVAHEPRPFIVLAGDRNVTARGTVFDVSLGRDGAVEVRLLRGSVDVGTIPARTGGGSTAPVARLRPGETLISDQGTTRVARTDPKLTIPGVDWATPSQDFERARLADVVARSNRAGAVRIRLAGDVGELRISGRFQVNDPQLLANRLATLFDLSQDRSNPDEIELRQR